MKRWKTRALSVVLSISMLVPLQSNWVNAEETTEEIGVAAVYTDDDLESELEEEKEKEEILPDGFSLGDEQDYSLQDVEDNQYLEIEPETTAVTFDAVATATDATETDAIAENIDPQTASSTSGTCGTSVKWSLSNGTLTISGTGDMAAYSDSSNAPWYDSRASITSVKINSGVTSVGTQAFKNCSSLTSVSIASTVNKIGGAAFYYCTSLKSVTLPSSVKTISSGAFAGCSSLSSFSAPGVETISSYAFQGTAFTSFEIPKTLKSIDSLAFYSTKISSFSVEAGNSVYTVSSGVVFTDSGKTLSFYPPYKSGTSYKIPNSVTKIGSCAFINNACLTSIDLNKVQTIESSAFQGTQLQSVTIPDSVTSVGDFTFYKSNVQSVTFGKGLTETSYQMFENCYNLTTINFGSTLTTLGAQSFAYCTALKSVTLPANIKEIESGCFAECSNLTSFTSKGLTVIPYQAFLNDTKLTSVSLNSGVTKIYRYAFGGCTGLKSITLPATVTYVDSNAFETNTTITCLNKKMDKYGKNGYRELDVVSVTGTRKYDMAYQVLTKVNEERAKVGASALVMDSSLLETAMTRAAETTVLFSHTRPDSSSCFTANSSMYAENIAYGQTSATSVMTSWMNSSGHKANIINSSYKTIGIGCYEINGTYYWVQCFGTGSNTSSCAQPSNASKTQSINIATETFSEASTTSGIIWGSVDEYTYALTLSIPTSNLKVGGTTTAVAYINNPGAGTTKINANMVKWSSSNTGVATIDGSGKITIKGSGTAVITATTSEGYYKATSTLTVSGSGVTVNANTPTNNTQTVQAVTVSYRTHIQNQGWENSWRTNGTMSGTSGKGLRLEGINVKVSGDSNLGIQYTTHCQDYGWLPWVSNGEMSGTEGEAKRLEAIKIQLTGSDKNNYDVYYRVHAQNFGWLNWAKNGEASGTAGYGYRLEAIQIVVVKKGAGISSNYGGITTANTSAYVSKGSSTVNVSGADTTNVTYRTHVQNVGWQGWKYNGGFSGTSGKGYRLEGINIKLTNAQYSGGITYRTHIQNIGWETAWKSDGAMSGTSGRGLRLEAIQIKLTGEMANQYDVYYRVHAQNFGWLGWAKNGASAGTEGYGYRLEGIQIVLVKKGGSAPASNYGGLTSNTTKAYVGK
jgi:uncharacterized protein YjdB/uncharacterized protein YkwD